MIFNHTNERGVNRYIDSEELGLFIWTQTLLFSIICKSAVPIFFMISGSMLLSKEESIKRTFMRISPILIDLILFSIIYFRIDAVNDPFSYKNTLQSILLNSYWHLWFLYAYIAFIVTVPFLRKLVIALDEKTSMYLFAIATIFMGVVPIAEHFLPIDIYWNLKPNWLTANIFIYPVIGYVIDNKINVSRMKKSSLAYIWIINLICFIVCEICEYQYLVMESGDPYNEMFLTSFCLINASSIYVTVKFLFENNITNPFVYKLITETGKCTFGIYLLHILVLWKIPFLYDCWIKLEQSGTFGTYAGIFVSCIGVFMITAIIVYLLRKIPVIKKLF